VKLPQFQMADKDLSLLQTTWATILQPLLNRPQNSSNILPDIDLVTGDNTIPHTLNRDLVGWKVIRINAASTIYDKQDTNRTPATNLILNSSANCTVSLEVF
jgi:hypothetical protein